MAKQKVIIYVDGFNFYYGLRSKAWKCYYWLDMVNFFSSFLKPHQELVKLYYFSARQTDPGKSSRQDLLFQANANNPKFKLILGKYLPKKITCKICHKKFQSYEEKETDVRIATQLLLDAYNNACDVAMIVSADSDLVPPIQAINKLNPKQKIIACFPPNRNSYNIRQLCNGVINLDGASTKFAAHVLPPSVTLKSGFVINKPAGWV